LVDAVDVHPAAGGRKAGRVDRPAVRAPHPDAAGGEAGAGAQIETGVRESFERSVKSLMSAGTLPVGVLPAMLEP
jgi:hypothetical protein